MIDADGFLHTSDIPAPLTKKEIETIRDNSRLELNKDSRKNIPVLLGLELLGYGPKYISGYVGVTKQAVSSWRHNINEMPPFIAIVLTSTLRKIIGIHRDGWAKDGKKSVITDFKLNVAEELCDIQETVNQVDYPRSEWWKALEFVDMRRKAKEALDDDTPVLPDIIGFKGEDGVDPEGE